MYAKDIINIYERGEHCSWNPDRNQYTSRQWAHGRVVRISLSDHEDCVRILSWSISYRRCRGDPSVQHLWKVPEIPTTYGLDPNLMSEIGYTKLFGIVELSLTYDAVTSHHDTGFERTRFDQAADNAMIMLTLQETVSKLC